MSALILPDDIYGVTEKSGVPVVSSRKVAETFSKRHDSVLRDIQNTIASLTEISLHKIVGPNFKPELNFISSTYKDRGKKYPEYLLTRDGFTLLAMGFTGKKAMAFKVAYINRFNEMESFIRNLAEAKADFPEFTQAIMLSHEEPKHYHFSNELDMINRVVLGMDAKHFKEAHNLEKVSSIRPYLAPDQAEAVKTLQRIDIGLILAVPDFQHRKEMLTEHYNRRQGMKVIA